MSAYQRKAPAISERRLNAISGGYDSPAALLRAYDGQEVRQRVRTFAQDTTNDLIDALRLIRTIAGAAIVVHGPRGCAMALLDRAQSSAPGGPWAVTNLNERDTIVGSEHVLRETILALDRRSRPELIFVVTTPVVAINNDDVVTVVSELQDEVGARLVPVFSDGFTSRIARSGYDLVLHALFRDVISRARPAPDAAPFANLISVSEHQRDREELGRLLATLGISGTFIPNTAYRHELEQAVGARWSIGVNPDESEYLGEALAQQAAIPFIQPDLPLGSAATFGWLAAVGDAVGLEAAAVAQIHAQEIAALAASFARHQLRGARVTLSLPAPYAFGIRDLLGELGAEVVGLTVHALDQRHRAQLERLRDERPGLPLHIGAGQRFEEANILKRLAPDLHLCWDEHALVALRLGIPAVALREIGVLGYRGAARFAQIAARALQNRAFATSLGAASGSPYKDSWYQKKPDWYLKHEVK